MDRSARLALLNGQSGEARMPYPLMGVAVAAPISHLSDFGPMIQAAYAWFQHPKRQVHAWASHKPCAMGPGTALSSQKAPSTPSWFNASDVHAPCHWMHHVLGRAAGTQAMRLRLSATSEHEPRILRGPAAPTKTDSDRQDRGGPVRSSRSKIFGSGKVRTAVDCARGHPAGHSGQGMPHSHWIGRVGEQPVV